VNVAGHSDHNGDYPDARHAQGHECHSREAFVDRAAAIWTSRAGPAYRSRCVSGWSAKGSGSTYGRAGRRQLGWPLGALGRWGAGALGHWGTGALGHWGTGALGGALRGRWAAQRFVRRAALVRRHDQSHSQVGTCGLTRRVEGSDLPSSQAMGPRHTCCRTRPREGAPGPTSQAARYLGASNLGSSHEAPSPWEASPFLPANPLADLSPMKRVGSGQRRSHVVLKPRLLPYSGFAGSQ
jgi:hypothetical protein